MLDLLCVVQGRKKVKLFSPNRINELNANPIWMEHSNHSTIANAVLPEPNLTAILEAGDALFLPEGYWHAVESDSHTLAFNFWFYGMRVRIMNHQSEVRLYPKEINSLYN